MQKKEPDRFSRRTLLMAGGTMGLSLGASGLPALSSASIENSVDHDHAVDPENTNATVEFVPGAPFVEPEVRRSVDGELNTTLRLQYAYKDIGGYRLFMRSYEGTIPVRPCA